MSELRPWQRHALADARMKVQWARTHLDHLKASIAEFDASPDRYSVFVDYDAQEGCYVALTQARRPWEMPPLGLPVGDFVHSARAALDYITWQLATRHLKREPTQNEAKNIDFPITSNAAYFANARVLPYVSDIAKQELARHQPEVGRRTDPLALLKWLSNVDKHRVVLTIYGVSGEYAWRYLVPAGYTVHVENPTDWQLWDRLQTRWGADGFRGPSVHEIIKLDPAGGPSVPIDVDLYHQSPISISFRGPTPEDHIRVTELEAIADRVEYVIGCFDRFF